MAVDFFFQDLGGINWYSQWTAVMNIREEGCYITDALTVDENLSRRFHVIKPRQVDVIFSV